LDFSVGADIDLVAPNLPRIAVCCIADIRRPTTGSLGIVSQWYDVCIAPVLSGLRSAFLSFGGMMNDLSEWILGPILDDLARPDREAR
jgi:hypothetical protein